MKITHPSDHHYLAWFKRMGYTVHGTTLATDMRRRFRKCYDEGVSVGKGIQASIDGKVVDAPLSDYRQPRIKQVRYTESGSKPKRNGRK